MEKKTVLFAPLNWGLGHASRSIPIIYEHLSQYNVLLAADGEAYSLLNQEFPQLKIIRLTDIRVKYLKGFLFPLGLCTIALKISYRNYKEHIQLAQIIEQESVDMVISDNRYGLWSKKVKSILITHQLSIIPPKILRFTTVFLRKIIQKKLSHFDEVWVPDYDSEPSLAGLLSHQKNVHPTIKYIGPISRYNQETVDENEEIIAIISGPEPFRNQLVNKLAEISTTNSMEITLYGNGIKLTEEAPFVNVIQKASFYQLNTALNQANLVIASGGYTTLMDLHLLEKRAILIPTPNQTEQEYLADINQLHPLFTFVTFENLHKLSEIIKQQKQKIDKEKNQ